MIPDAPLDREDPHALPAGPCLGWGGVLCIGFGLNLFLVPLLVRAYGLPLPQAGLIFALSFSLATAVGTALGGFTLGRLAARDPRGTAGRRRWRSPSRCRSICSRLCRRTGALMALLFAATAALYAFRPAIMTVTQTLVEPRMRASAAALHAFGQTVAGLGIGSVLLGFLSDRLAARAFHGDYRALCLPHHGAPSPACLAASTAGLGHAMLAVAAILPIAIWNYLRAARALPADLARENHG